MTGGKWWHLEGTDFVWGHFLKVKMTLHRSHARLLHQLVFLLLFHNILQITSYRTLIFTLLSKNSQITLPLFLIVTVVRIQNSKSVKYILYFLNT